MRRWIASRQALWVFGLAMLVVLVLSFHYPSLQWVAVALIALTLTSVILRRM